MRRERLRVRWLGLVLLVFLIGCSQQRGGDPPSASPSPVAPTTVADQASSGSNDVTATPEPSPFPSPTPTVGPTATPTRVPTGALTICMAQEPASLFVYGPDSYAARMVREAIYDGPIDTRGYDLQPVILEKIPSLADGDARLETVTVTEGQRVVDISGDVVTLRDGITVRPAGCLDEQCSVTYMRDAGSESADGTGEATGEGEASADSATDEPPAATLEMDRLVVDFSLLEGLVWSDGEPLTARDSVFSYEVAQSAEIPPRQRTGQQGVVPARRIDPVERTSGYEAIDELTVRWSGLPGYLDPYYQGNFFVPLPAHQLKELTPEEMQDREASARLPLGWGPYVLTDWTPGEQITAVRNPRYFRADEELPYFDSLVFKFGGESGFQLPQALTDGECDIVASDALGTDWGTYTGWQADGLLQFQATPGTIWEHVDFGINPSSQVTWRGDLFEDVRVRQAFAYCIDRQALMNDVMGGLSVVPDTFVPPNHPLYPQDGLNPYAYDPQAGRDLLQQAGWRDTNGDGALESYGVEGLADGSTMVFDFVTTTSALRERVGEIVVDNLSQCGVRANLTPDPVPPQVFFAPDISSPIFGRTFDMTGFAWFADMLPPCHLYLSSEIPTASTGWSGFNVAGFENEEYDRACLAARDTLPGMDSYASRQMAPMRIFNEQLPAIPLFVHLKSALARPGVEGLTLDPTQTADIWNVETLSRARQ